MAQTLSLPWGVVLLCILTFLNVPPAAPLYPVFCGAATTPAWSSYQRAPRARAWVGGVMLRRASFANASITPLDLVAEAIRDGHRLVRKPSLMNHTREERRACV
eukprot:3521362-Prymnesium_polylepis.1